MFLNPSWSFSSGVQTGHSAIGPGIDTSNPALLTLQGDLLQLLSRCHGTVACLLMLSLQPCAHLQRLLCPLQGGVLRSAGGLQLQGIEPRPQHGLHVSLPLLQARAQLLHGILYSSHRNCQSRFEIRVLCGCLLCLELLSNVQRSFSQKAAPHLVLLSQAYGLIA